MKALYNLLKPLNINDTFETNHPFAGINWNQNLVWKITDIWIGKYCKKILGKEFSNKKFVLYFLEAHLKEHKFTTLAVAFSLDTKGKVKSHRCMSHEMAETNFSDFKEDTK